MGKKPALKSTKRPEAPEGLLHVSKRLKTLQHNLFKQSVDESSEVVSSLEWNKFVSLNAAFVAPEETRSLSVRIRSFESVD